MELQRVVQKLRYGCCLKPPRESGLSNCTFDANILDPFSLKGRTC